ncbi:hypothetical protein [Pseudoflavitalea sp. G-6-1-2]|uniref:hypothetical protein n=1 Tax=Pseudoflavitalea sp. G-6-1-2 TaxID=2728841 RepID=UPI00197DA492|nr:hypothetical protein [Pseudoflavitalea sp. G-6-1-2]
MNLTVSFGRWILLRTVNQGSIGRSSRTLDLDWFVHRIWTMVFSTDNWTLVDQGLWTRFDHLDFGLLNSLNSFPDIGSDFGFLKRKKKLTDTGFFGFSWILDLVHRLFSDIGLIDLVINQLLKQKYCRRPWFARAEQLDLKCSAFTAVIVVFQPIISYSLYARIVELPEMPCFSGF